MLSKPISEVSDLTLQIISFEKDPRFVYKATATLLNDYLVIIGGVISEKAEEVLIFNISAGQWQKPILEGAKLNHREKHTACLYDENKIIVYGGEEMSKAANTIVILHLLQENDEGPRFHCELINMKEEDPRKYSHCAQVFQGKMFVFGGFQEGPRNELWSLDLQNFQWEKCSQSGTLPNSNGVHKSVLVNNQMIVYTVFDIRIPKAVFGGIEATSLSCLNLETLKWSQILCTTTASLPRYGNFTQHQGLFYVLDCNQPNTKGTKRFELFILNPNERKWKKIKLQTTYPDLAPFQLIIPYKNGFFFYGNQFCTSDRLSALHFLNLPSSSQVEKESEYWNQISQLYLKSQYSDVIFVVENKNIFAHKLVLGTRCHYFAKMFSSGMLESNQKEIKVCDCTAKIFEAFLKYIYHGKIDLTEELAQALLELSDKWVYNELKDKCEEFLIQTLSIENVVKISELANKLETEKLKTNVIEFVIENVEEMASRDDIGNISSELYLEIISKLKKRTELEALLKP